VLLLRVGDSLMDGWMWRLAEAEAIHRWAPRSIGGTNWARNRPGRLAGRPGPTGPGLLRPLLAPRCFSVNCWLSPLCMWALDVIFSTV
jgi:hypothetical protein